MKVMVTFPNLVEFWPILERNLYKMPCAQYLISNSENSTQNTMDFTLSNAIGLTGIWILYEEFMTVLPGTLFETSYRTSQKPYLP
jgi:hypothetical protein